MSHNPDFLDTIDEVAATKEFLDSVMEYMYDFLDFLMFIKKTLKNSLNFKNPWPKILTMLF